MLGRWDGGLWAASKGLVPWGAHEASVLANATQTLPGRPSCLVPTPYKARLQNRPASSGIAQRPRRLCSSLCLVSLGRPPVAAEQQGSAPSSPASLLSLVAKLRSRCRIGRPGRGGGTWGPTTDAEWPARNGGVGIGRSVRPQSGQAGWRRRNRARTAPAAPTPVRCPGCSRRWRRWTSRGVRGRGGRVAGGGQSPAPGTRTKGGLEPSLELPGLAQEAWPQGVAGKALERPVSSADG